MSDTQNKTGGTARLHYMGRSSVRLETGGGTIIYIDPYAGRHREYKVPADLVLVTHQHGDHNKVSLVKMKDGGKIIQCPDDIKSGDVVESHGVHIRAVDAYNPNHLKESSCGFIITIGDLVVYHSGDTSTTEQMTGFKEYGIDYAMLCSDGYFNMGVEEVMEVARLIEARHVVPIHTAPREDYSRETMDKITLENKIAMKPGSEITLS